MKKLLVISLMLAMVLMAAPAFAWTAWHVNGTVVGGTANLTGAIGGNVGSTYANAAIAGVAQSSNQGGGSGFGANFGPISIANGGSGGTSTAGALGLAEAGATQTNFGAGVAVKGYFVGGIVSGGAFGF